MSAQRLSSTTAFSGRVFRVDVDRVQLPHGREATLEVVRHAPSVVLVPIPEPGRVVLIRQYRYPVDRWLWELPAGSVDEGESLETAARRECHEEIGMVPDRLEPLGTFLPTPGYCDEEMNVFALRGLSTPSHAAELDPDEHIESRTVSLEEARSMIGRGEIVDMKTIVALLLVEQQST